MSAEFDKTSSVDATASGTSAVAAGGSIRQALTGAGSVAWHIENVGTLIPDACPSAESVDCPARLTNLYSRANLFIGRDHELDVLDEASPVSGQSLAHVLYGLGGIGKSTLAARWASAHSTSHAPVWWITADSRVSVDAGLSDLAAALQPSLRTVLPQEQLTEWGSRWLASHSDWLLVLDNVTNPADVEPLLARAATGRFLITSRRSTGWHGIADEMPLDVLSMDEAVDLFTRIRGEDEDTAELCAELGCLPLAVAQAAAYCKETDCSARAYLDDLAAYPAMMYAETEASGDHERTVARVWHITLDRLASDPLAVRILLMLGWFAPEAVPRSLFASLGTPPAVRRALGRLSAHSMITLSGDSVSVHRLVQAVSRLRDDHDPHRHREAIAEARESATRALADALPDDVQEASAWPVMRALTPHVEALAQHAPPAEDTADMARLLTATGDYMSTVGLRLAHRAFSLLRRAEAAATRIHGADSVEALTARVEVAHLTRMLRDVATAAPVSERALADCMRVLGAEHKVTLSAQMNVQKITALSGDREGALRLAEETLAGRTRVLGANAPATFDARIAVAMALFECDGVPRARALLYEVVADCARVFGDEHPQTLAARSTAAVLARQPDHFGGTMDMIGRIMTAAEGDGDVVSVVRDMVETFSSMNPSPVVRPTEEDVATAERNLDVCLRVLGDDHVDSLAARLALLQVYAGIQEERYAEPAARLIEDVMSALGEDKQLVGLLTIFAQVLQTVVEELVDEDETDDSAQPN